MATVTVYCEDCGFTSEFADQGRFHTVLTKASISARAHGSQTGHETYIDGPEVSA